MTTPIFDPADPLRTLRALGKVFVGKFRGAPVPRDAATMIQFFGEIETEALNFLKAELGSSIPFADGELEP